MRGSIRILGAISLSAAMLPASLYAASEPSLAETTAWLTSKLKQDYSRMNVIPNGSTLAAGSSQVNRWNGCDLELGTVFVTAAKVAGKQSGFRTVQDYVIPVGTLDASDALIERLDEGTQPLWRLTVHTQGRQKTIKEAIKVEWNPGEGVWQHEMVDRFAVTFESHELADRVVNALRRVSDLCGAPHEPF